MDGSVSPLPLGEDGEEVSDGLDDSENKLADPPHEQVSEPVAFSSCHCKLVGDLK